MGPLLLLRGKEKKKAFLSLQGSQMSLAVSKLRVSSAFGSASEPLEPELLEATGTSPLCVRRELTANKVAGGVFALEKWIRNEKKAKLKSSYRNCVFMCVLAYVHSVRSVGVSA